MLPFTSRRNGVGVVEFYGPIGSGNQVAEQLKLLNTALMSKRVKALLLDIDSPGGTVGGSEAIYFMLGRIANRKPVVAYIRGVGASGAYLISCPAARIISLPSALVGSIGVLYLRPALQDLLERFGIGLSVYKGGRLKDMTGFWRSPTDEEDEKFESLIAEVHESFIRCVAKGRNLEVDKVTELATGEVFTGLSAEKLRLVDELGDFHHALQVAADLGGVRANPLWIRPRRSLLERFAGRFGREMASGLASGIRQELPAGLYYGNPGMFGGRWGD